MSQKEKPVKSRWSKPGVRTMLGVSVIAGCGLFLAVSGCSNSIKVSSDNASLLNANAKLPPLTFKRIENLSIQNELLGISFASKNRALLLLNDGSSLGVDLSAEAPEAKPLKPTPDPETLSEGAAVVALSETEYWTVSKTRIVVRYEKEGSGLSTVSADVSFPTQPEIVAASTRSILLKVAGVYKLIRVAGKLEVAYDDVLNFQGRASPMSQVLGAGIVGDLGFWVSDGERLVSLLIKSPGDAPNVFVSRIQSVGLSSPTKLGYFVEESDGKVVVAGAAIGYRKSDGSFYKSNEVSAGGGGTPVSSGEIADAAVLKIAQETCVSCHGPAAQNSFKGATLEASWKNSAQKIKMHLEKNSMPPSGASLQVRQSLAAYLKSIAGIDVTINSSNDNPNPQQTVDPKLAEFNMTYKQIIQNSCVNQCHNHGFVLDGQADFARVKLNAASMKERLEFGATTPPQARAMPPPNNQQGITIGAQQRTQLINWLQGLNP